MTSIGDEYIELAVDYIHKTEEAILLDDGTGRRAWFPLSRLRYDGDLNDLERHQSITVETQEWLAHNKGFI